jgi:GNAT superfamily N-acetyltransferase
MAETRRLILRDASPDEFDTVADVIRAAYREYSADMPEDRWERYIARSADVRSRVNESVLVIAEVDGRIVGTATYYPVGRAESAGGWPADWAGIRLLGVVPQARGSGIGRALIEECIQRASAEGATAVGLHTTERMQIAKAMYERMGFVLIPDSDFGPSDRPTVLAYRYDLASVSS